MATTFASPAEIALHFSALAEEHGPAFEMVEGCVAFSDEDRVYTIELHENRACLIFNTTVAQNLPDLTVEQLASAMALNHDPDFCAHGWLSPDLARHEILLLGRCPTQALTTEGLWATIESFVGFTSTVAEHLATRLNAVAPDRGPDELASESWLRV